MPPWFADLEPGGMRFTAIGSKLYANGERLHIKGVNWFGSEGRSGPPLGLDKHTSKRALTREEINSFLSLSHLADESVLSRFFILSQSRGT